MFLRCHHFYVEPASRAKQNDLKYIVSALEKNKTGFSEKKVLDRLLAALEKASRQETPKTKPGLA